MGRWTKCRSVRRQKKLAKGKPVSEIADALEESEREIERLIQEMQQK